VIRKFNESRKCADILFESRWHFENTNGVFLQAKAKEVSAADGDKHFASSEQKTTMGNEFIL